MMVDPEDTAIRRIKELERELKNTKGSLEVITLGYELIVTERDVLAERAEEAREEIDTLAKMVMDICGNPKGVSESMQDELYEVALECFKKSQMEQSDGQEIN